MNDIYLSIKDRQRTEHQGSILCCPQMCYNTHVVRIPKSNKKNKQLIRVLPERKEDALVDAIGVFCVSDYWSQNSIEVFAATF